MDNRNAFFTLKHPLSLRYFYEVAQAGSFRGAGENIHVAASAINRHVKYLENEIGLLLFERNPGRGGLKLTVAGQIFLNRLNRAMSELNSIQSELDELIGTKRSIVNLGLNEGIRRVIMPKLLEILKNSYLNINYNIVSGNSKYLIQSLLRDEIDFAIAFNPPSHTSINFKFKFKVGVCVMMARSHPLANRRSVHLQDCIPYDLILPDATLSLRVILDQIFLNASMAPRILITTNSHEIMRTAVESEVGIAVLTHLIQEKKENISQVKFIPLYDPNLASQELVCCVKAGRELSPSSMAIIESIKAIFTN